MWIVDIWSFFSSETRTLLHVGGRMLQDWSRGTHQLLLKSSTTRNGHKNLDQEKRAQNIKKKSVLWPTFDRKKNACVYFEPLLSVLTFLSTTTSWEQSHIVRKQLLEKSLFTPSSHIMCSEWCDLPDFEVHGGAQSVKMCCEWPMGWVIIKVNYTVSDLTPRCLTKRPFVRFLEVNIKAN